MPFGARELVGVLLAVSANSDMPAQSLRPALAWLDDTPLLGATTLALCSWAADYYCHPIGEVIAAGLPRGLREGRPLPERVLRLSRRGLGLAEGALRRARSQARAIALLQEKGSCGAGELIAAGVSRAVLRELARKELIEEYLPAPSTPAAGLRGSGPALQREQEQALAAISAAPGFNCHLLEGVTGSGKTEIYLRLIEQCLQRGQQALVLVPEIGLTPQTFARFADRFDTIVATLHSGLADGQRLRDWQRAQNGRAGIVLGTRSAVLTPMASLGLIVVDEEHDLSYKQSDGFRYSARDVAVKRAQLDNCPVILGSATPSLESLFNVRRSRYRHHRLRHRVAGGALPALETVDLRGLPLQAGVSAKLLEELRQIVEIRGQQALLFLNRRGYAPTLQCHDCGWVAGCEHCDARLTVHLRKRSLRCHHCAARYPLPGRCPHCRSDALMTRGLGTEQTESYLAATLNCPVHRVDSDAMRGAEAMQALLDIAHSREPCVLLGTQMLTKGHHFPAVQLVGVIDTDALLFSADFRGPERMAQLLVQVAGRAGREMHGGRVVVQTHYPDHEAFTALGEGDYHGLANRLLDSRDAVGLPPGGQLSLLRVDARDEAAGQRFLQDLRGRVAGQLPAGCRLIGPLPSAMPRRAGRFRWQLWCLAGNRGSAMQANRLLVAEAGGASRQRDLNWFLDVDAQDVI